MPGRSSHDDALRRRFGPIFERIAAGAVERETRRRLPLEEVGWLRDAGFGAVRVPVEHGGSGATLHQLFELLVDLSAAESNLVQALRAHFAFAENSIAERGTERGARWVQRIGGGAIVGAASAERSGNLRGSFATQLMKVGNKLLLNGTKYYSTGSLYADYLSVHAMSDGRRVNVVVPAHAPGVTRVDDYAGFGQRTSASGTTIFADVEVDPAEVQYPSVASPYSGEMSIAQLVHLATLAGILRRATDDTAAFVRHRRRSYTQGSADLPREDPLVQQVLGHADSAAHAARSIVLTVASKLEAARAARYELRIGPAEFRTAAAEERVTRLELEAELDVYRAQTSVIDLALRATTEIFDVGGASALDESLKLDRHWRNARTIASHNPAIYRTRIVGDYLLNGTKPVYISSVGEASSVVPVSDRT
jgi:alkylation response protein AidB-like acyl-CoA dehydrogenase